LRGGERQRECKGEGKGGARAREGTGEREKETQIGKPSEEERRCSAREHRDRARGR